MSRRSAGWVPNQHGAWAMLASPLLVGALAGGAAWAHLLLAAFWFAGYFAFFAASQWLKSRRRARYRPSVLTYGAVALVLGVLLLVVRPDLVWWAPLFLPPLGVGLWAAAHRRERDLLAGLTTVLASGLMTVVAYDLALSPSAALPARAWELALVQLLYFAGTVFYVKSAIRERRNERFRLVSTGYHAAATLVVLPLSGWLALVFAALTVRAYVVPPRGLRPALLGIGEFVATVTVAVVSLLAL